MPVKSAAAKGGKGAKKAGAGAGAAAEVKVGEKTISILDGQHRVGALEILLKKEARIEGRVESSRFCPTSFAHAPVRANRALFFA